MATNTTSSGLDYLEEEFAVLKALRVRLTS